MRTIALLSRRCETSPCSFVQAIGSPWSDQMERERQPCCGSWPASTNLYRASSGVGAGYLRCSIFSLGIDSEVSGYDNIRLRGLILGLTANEIEERMGDIVEFTELGDYLDIPVRTYSAGMMTRLTFAVATCFAPEILLMDEWIMAGDAGFLAKAQQRVRVVRFTKRASSYWHRIVSRLAASFATRGFGWIRAWSRRKARSMRFSTPTPRAQSDKICGFDQPA